MAQEKAFLGTGWKFPVSVDRRTGRIAMVSYEDDIAESIGIILRTRRGERVMEPEFGCDLFQYVFGSIQEDQIAEIRNCVKEALRKWETRIIDVAVEVETQQISAGILLLSISYVVRATNTPYNMVYPYYISEGV